MLAKDAFSYVYHILKENGYLHSEMKRNAIKTNKILFFAELYHRLFFGEALITNTKFKAQPNGPALDKTDVNWDNIESNYNYLTNDEKETIKVCMKDWLCEMSAEDLAELSHGDGRIKLTAWRDVKNYGNWGTVELSDEALDKDASILHKETSHKYTISNS